MKKILLLFFFFVILKSYTQNKQVLYNFAELPQTLLQNPGSETNYKYHFGLPLLSGVSAEVGSTGFSLKELFSKDNRSINDKVSEVLSKLNTRDYLKIHSQIEVLNVGYRYNQKIYFSFGFYEEIDAIAYFPRDMVTLANEGNAAYINRSFNVSQVNYKLEALGVLHFGASKKINDKLTLGGRVKLYSSALNMQSTNNTGTFTTIEGNNNIYTHYLDNINIDLKTSGLVLDDEYIDDANTYLSNTFFGSNLGVGLDFGLTYKLNPQLEFTASILDVGFINHKKNIKNTTLKGSHNFDGLEFEFNNSSINYWQEFDEEFREKLPLKENNISYISWRPAKLNASLRYNFGEKKSKYCYDNTFKDYYKNAVGAQLYSVIRPLGPQLAFTGFYEARFAQKLQAKVTYTLDEYSLYNIGAGISAQIGKVNFYGMVDNLTQINDIAGSNHISLQVGFNVIFN